MPHDLSHLDSKYFIDPYRYNCPYCNRRHASYGLKDWQRFDWSNDKQCYVYYVQCESCQKLSMHLSYSFMVVGGTRRFADGVEIDEQIFYSTPTSFHTIDERIPRGIREVLAEAQGCLTSNYLTGASACVRKAIYELAADQHATGDSYDDRIRSLKVKLSSIDPTFFDTLVTIQEATSSKVHETSYDGWSARHLRVMIASITEVIREIYVVPDERKRRRETIIAMAKELRPREGEAKP